MMNMSDAQNPHSHCHTNASNVTAGRHGSAWPDLHGGAALQERGVGCVCCLPHSKCKRHAVAAARN